MDEIRTDIVSPEDGEYQLSLLIKQAGNEARNRRQKILDEHFDKLNRVIKEAVSRTRVILPT